MKIHKELKHIYNSFFSMLILFNLTLTIMMLPSISTDSVEDGADELEKKEETFSINDIESIGVQWAYKRPAKTDKGPSTCWKLRWAPDGTKIAVVYFDYTALIFDSKTGKIIKTLGIGDSEDNVGSGDGESNDNGTRCYGYSSDPTVPLLRACAWSPDGKLLAISGDHMLIEIYDTATWDKKMVLEGHTGSVLSLEFSPNGEWLASGEGTDKVIMHNKNTCQNIIKIWNVTTGSEKYTLSGHNHGILSLHWSQNGSRLVSASDDKDLKMWDAEKGTLLFTLGEGLGHSGGVLDVDWSPNQTMLVSGSRDYKIRLWHVGNGTPADKPWKDHNCVRSTHWHQNGKYILTAGVDQSIKIRNSTTGEEIRIFEEAVESNSEVMSARWSPDGYQFAACSTRDGAVRLYSLGFSEPDADEAYTDWRIGISIFSVIMVIGIIIIFIPLVNEFRQHRK